MPVVDNTKGQSAIFPEFADINKRIASFQGWPPQIRQKPQQLANAGFYYTGYRDCVQCYYCGIKLRDWEDGDDPWAEHARHVPNCHLVQSRPRKQHGPGTAVLGYVEVPDGNIRDKWSKPDKSKEVIDSGKGPSFDTLPPTPRHTSPVNGQIRLYRFPGVTTPVRNGTVERIHRSIQPTDLWTPSNSEECERFNGSNWRRLSETDVLLPSPAHCFGEVNHLTIMASRGQTAFDVSSPDQSALDTPKSEEMQINQLTSLISLSTSFTFGIPEDLSVSGDDSASMVNNEAKAEKRAVKGASILEEGQSSSMVAQPPVKHQQTRGASVVGPRPGIQRGPCQLPSPMLGRTGIGEVQRLSGRHINPIYPEYVSLCARLSSFFGYHGRASAERLALAGFFFTGCGDFVRCFHCGCAIQFWKYNEDPVAEHLLISPCCQYIRRYTS